MDYAKLTISEIREKLDKKEIDTTTLVNNIFQNIEEDNKRDDKIFAFVELFKEDALKQALETQEKINKGEKLPLLGVPIAIKDNICYSGHEMTASSKMLKGYIAPYTATSLKRLIDAGAIIIGRTNMDEFATGGTTETSNYGITRNPVNREYVPGGSSGGSAAAVCANFAYAAMGSDTGGSIRQPASFCGVVGVKPTYGRIPRLGCVALASSLDQIGPLTKDVKDAALMTKIMAGYSDKEETALNVEVPDYLKYLDGKVDGMKVGLPKEYFNSTLINSEVKKSVETAIKLLEKNGAKITEISLPNAKYGTMVYTAIMSAELASNMGRYDGIRYGYHPEGDMNLEEYYTKARTDSFDFELQARILFGTVITGVKYYKSHYEHALKVRRLMQDDFNKAFESVDVIVSPTSPVVAGKLGTRDKTDSELSFLADSYVSNLNLVGLPSMSIPSGVDSNKLPIGIQFIAKHFKEETMFKAAFACETFLKG